MTTHITATKVVTIKPSGKVLLVLVAAKPGAKVLLAGLFISRSRK